MSFLEIRRPGSLARAMSQRLKSLAHQFTPHAAEPVRTKAEGEHVGFCGSAGPQDTGRTQVEGQYRCVIEAEIWR
jgi:hypothetical protein